MVNRYLLIRGLGKSGHGSGSQRGITGVQLCIVDDVYTGVKTSTDSPYLKCENARYVLDGLEASSSFQLRTRAMTFAA